MSIAELLAVPFNAMRLEHINHSEAHNPTSALNRYRRMLTPAPPITIALDGTVLDGLHRLAVAAMTGRVTIAANRKTAEPNKTR